MADVRVGLEFGEAVVDLGRGDRREEVADVGGDDPAAGSSNPIAFSLFSTSILYLLYLCGVRQDIDSTILAQRHLIVRIRFRHYMFFLSVISAPWLTYLLWQ